MKKRLKKYLCRYLGCGGGRKKCFSGETAFGGVTVSGAFYMERQSVKR